MSSSENPTVVETSFPVRYAETDAMGVVHHATYLVYFEEGRSHYMRHIGSDYAHVEASGFQLPVTELDIRFVGSLRYGELVTIRTWVAENRSRKISFSYEVIDGKSGKTLVTGTTRHIWTDSQGNVSRAPEKWSRLFNDIS